MRDTVLIAGSLIIGTVCLFHAYSQFAEGPRLIWGNWLALNGFAAVIEDLLGAKRAQWLFAYWWGLVGSICIYAGIYAGRKKFAKPAVTTHALGKTIR